MTRLSNDPELRREFEQVRSDIAADRERLTQAWDDWDEIARERQELLASIWKSSRHRDIGAPRILYDATHLARYAVASSAVVGQLMLIALFLVGTSIAAPSLIEDSLVVTVPLVILSSLVVLFVFYAGLRWMARQKWARFKMTTRPLEVERIHRKSAHLSAPGPLAAELLFGPGGPTLQRRQFEALKQAALEQGWTAAEQAELAQLAFETAHEAELSHRETFSSVQEWIALHDSALKQPRLDEQQTD